MRVGEGPEVEEGPTQRLPCSAKPSSAQPTPTLPVLNGKVPLGQCAEWEKVSAFSLSPRRVEVKAT